MVKYDLVSFIGRYTDTPFEETELGQVLEELPELGTEGPWLAAGSLRRLLEGKGVESDLDFFFKDNNQLAEWTEAVLDLGAKEIKRTEHHITYELELEVREWPKGNNSYAQAVRSGELDPAYKTVKFELQAIYFQFYRDVNEVIDSFDFTICQLAYDGESLYAGDYTLWDLARKRLALNRLTFGVSTVRRLLKYTSQGYTACAGCIKSILEEVGKRPDVIQANVQYVD